MSRELWKIAEKSGNEGEAFVIESETRTIAWTANTYDDDAESEIITEDDERIAALIASAPAMQDALRDLIAAFPRTLHRNGAQNAALDAAQELIA